jgi:hypothetical protein
MSTASTETKDLLARLRGEVAAEQDRANRKERGDTQKKRFLSLDPGESVTFRILPPKGGDAGLKAGLDPFACHELHWGLGKNQNQAARCPRNFAIPSECAVCEAVAEHRKSKTPEDVNFVREMRAKSRYLFNVIVAGREDEGALLWETSYEPYTDIRALLLNNEYGFALFDPFDGISLTITRNGKGSDTKYEVVASRKNSTIGTKAQVEKWMSEMIDLSTYRNKQYTFEEMQSFLLGTASPNRETEDLPKVDKVEEKPTGRRKART